MADIGTLGFLVGAGDAARADLYRQEQDIKDRRDKFADDLFRVANSDDWPEQARVTAAQMRAELFSNKKLKPKDYANMWEQVRQASGRPGVVSEEVAAAKSNIPALQSLQRTVAQTRPVAPSRDDLTMRVPSNTPSLDLLRPPQSDIAGTGSFMNIRPQPAGPSILAPQSFGDVISEDLGESQRIVANAQPTPMIFGPITRAERSREAMDMFKQQQAMQLDMFRQQEQIRAANRPDKWTATAGGELMYNPETGAFRRTGYEKPENLDKDERAISDYITERGLPDTAANRNAARDYIRRRNAELGNVNDRSAAVDERWQQTFGAMTARFDAAERDRLLNNALTIRKQFEKDVSSPKLSLRMARDLEAAANKATRGGDFVMLYDLVKSVDPQSVVREGEVRLLQSMMSVIANMQQWAQKLVGSKAALPSEARRAAKDAATLLKQAAIGKWQEAVEVAETDAAMRQVQPGLIGIQELDPRTFTIRPKIYETPNLPQPQWPGRAPAGPPGTSSIEPGAVQAPPGSFAALLIEALK